MKEVCKECGLYLEICKSPHIGSDGDDFPDVLFIGEAPGREEDELGRPFIGKSGKFLRVVVEEIFLGKRVRYTNLVKCRPPKNNLNNTEWIKYCGAELYEEIAEFRPKVVVLLGVKASNFFELEMNRAGFFERDGVKYVATYHPSYIVNYGGDLNIFIKQLRYARELLEGGDSKGDSGEKNFKVRGDELDYTLVKDSSSLEGVVNYLNSHRDLVLAYDIETSPGLLPYVEGSKILMVSFSIREGESFCIPWEVEVTGSGLEVLRGESWRGAVKKAIGDIFKGRENIVAHKVGFDRKWLRYKGIEVSRGLCDTLLGHYFLYPSLKMNDLKSLCKRYDFGIQGYEKDLEEWFFQNKVFRSNRDFGKVPLKVLWRYSCSDADATLRLYRIVRKELEERGLWDIFDKFLMRATELIEDIENNGVYIDQEYLRELDKILEERSNKIANCIYDLPEVRRFVENKVFLRRGLKTKELFKYLSGEEFYYENAREVLNLNSSVQLQELLFKYCNLPVLGYTLGGKASTSEDILKSLKGLHSLPELILDLRKNETIRKMFILPSYEYIVKGFIHPHFNLNGTETGRLSSDSPNFQQITKNSEIRNMFKTRFSGGYICNADFSQIELRVLASISGDKNLRKIFLEGRDLHSEVASKVFGVSLEEVTKEQRNIAKAINFGGFYGRGAKSLIRDIGGTLEESKKYLEEFWKKFSGVQNWRRERFEEIKNKGFLITVFGRRRDFKEVFYLRESLSEGDQNRLYNIQNAGTNYLIQSPASDMMLISTMFMNEEMKELGLKSKVVGLIHDAVVSDIFPEELDIMISLHRKYLEDLWNGKLKDVPEWVNLDFLNVPILADIEVGSTWGKLEKVK